MTKKYRLVSGRKSTSPSQVPSRVGMVSEFVTRTEVESHRCQCRVNVFQHSQEPCMNDRGLARFECRTCDVKIQVWSYNIASLEFFGSHLKLMGYEEF